MWPFSGMRLRRQIETERLQAALAQEISQRRVNEHIRALTTSLCNPIQEGLPDWAKDRDETSWQMTQGQRIPHLYTEEDLREMQRRALELSLRPGGRAIIGTLENFVIGQESIIRCEDENPVVQEYWDEWFRVSNWDMKDKESFRRYIRDGMIFNRFFLPKSNTPIETNKFVHLITRFVEPLEIENWSGDINATYGIETDPDDIETIISFHRRHVRQDSTELREKIDPREMIYFKIGSDSNMKWGITHLVGAAEYIVKYEQWLEDRIKLNRIRHLYGLFAKADNPATSLTTLANKINNDTTGKTAAGEGTPKKALRSPSVLLQQGIEWEYKNLQIRAQDTKDDGRAIQLQVAAAVRLAEYVVRADASNSNYASTMVSESPMVKEFEALRDLHTRYTNLVSQKVLGYAIRTGQIPATSTKTTTTKEAKRAKELVFECRHKLNDHHKGLAESVIKALVEKTETVPTQTTVIREYPPLIHRDIKTESEAIAIQILNKLVSRRTASNKLGYDFDQEQELMQQDDDDQFARDKEREKDEAKESW
jgi:hypothetical protein